MNSYDVIIIGAGISGLTAGNYLARGGARVLLCEQASKTGGLFNSFERNGFVFDGGIKSVESSGIILPMLAQLGLLDQIGFIKDPVAMITAGHVQPIRSLDEVQLHFENIKTQFPAQAHGLERVGQDASRVFNFLDALLAYPNPLFYTPTEQKEMQSKWMKANSSKLMKAPWCLPLFNITLREYLGKHLSDVSLVDFLSAIFPDGTTAFFGLGYFRMFQDYQYPTGGIGKLPEAMTASFMKQGGTLLLNARVVKILMKEGGVRGVKLADGREFLANYILTSADANLTFRELLPRQAVPDEFLQKLVKAEPSHSAFSVFLCLDIPAAKLNFKDCQHVFYHPDLAGIREGDCLTRPDYFSHVPQEISCPSLHQPKLAPKGKSGLILSAMTSWHYAKNWGLKNGQPAARYEQLKEQYARQMIASLEQFIPGLSGHIESYSVATPRTIYDQTLNWQGGIMGWSYMRQKSFYRGSMLQILRSIQTPVKNLLMSGQWAFTPGGSPISVLTGKLAADEILKTK